MELTYVSGQIEHMRRQIQWQRREITDLERGGHSTKSANELLERMLAKVDGMCAEQDRQLKEQKLKYPGTDKVNQRAS
jgi:hypothetical protein